MKLVTNNKSNNHTLAIKELFLGSNAIYIAVAFLKESGLSEILSEIIGYLKDGNSLTIICGLDFGLTEPKALLRLYDLSRKYNILKLHANTVEEDNIVFHPKVFMAIREKEALLIIGSANLTSGGLKNNNECSIKMVVEKVDPLFSEMTAYFNALLKDSKQCTLLSILQYQTFYVQQKKARREVKAKSAGATNLFSYQNLLVWLASYRETNDIDQVFIEKSHHYDEAKIVLDTIADTNGITQKQFIPLLERLVRSKTQKGLWHSGSIYRKKTKVFEHASSFQQLVRFIRANKNERPFFVFDQAIKLVGEIEGSGVNTVTEIMMTYDRMRFANLNKNPITVLREEGGVDLKAHRNSFKGKDYEQYCELVTEIYQYLGLRNMLEIDSFFNDIYWQIK